MIDVALEVNKPGPSNHDVYLAIKDAMDDLGMVDLGGGDNSYGIGNSYEHEASGYRVEITISNP